MLFCSPQLFWKLIRMRVKLSGVLVRIEEVGYVFCKDVKFQEMLKSSGLFPSLSSSLKFTPIVQVSNRPSLLLMRAIHNLNEAENLPGIKNYLALERKAA